MNKSLKKSAIWFAVFVVFTALVKLVDVKPIGPEGSKVGFAALNKAVFDLCGTNSFFYQLTQFCGFVALGIVACFALLGLDQLIKRKSLHFVDSKIIAMGAFYVVVMLFYAIFLFVAVNYRPVYINNEPLEASYPSSHTMLALTVVFTFMKYNNFFKTARSKVDQKVFLIACWVFMVVTVIGRVLSGVHWTTDVIGAVILSIAIIYTYDPLVELVTAIHDENEKKRLARKAREERKNK